MTTPLPPSLPIDADGTVTLVLRLRPHAKTARAGRVTAPDVSRLLKPSWWTGAIWGQPGASDPMPEVVSVEQLGPLASRPVTVEVAGAEVKMHSTGALPVGKAPSGGKKAKAG